MSPIVMAGNADANSSASRYQLHNPESTLLYQLVARYYPAFKDRMLAEGRTLPGYVQREFDDFLKSGRPRVRFSASSLQQLPQRTTGCVQFQASGILPELGRTSHGRGGTPSGR